MLRRRLAQAQFSTYVWSSMCSWIWCSHTIYFIMIIIIILFSVRFVVLVDRSVVWFQHHSLHDDSLHHQSNYAHDESGGFASQWKWCSTIWRFLFSQTNEKENERKKKKKKRGRERKKPIVTWYTSFHVHFYSNILDSVSFRHYFLRQNHLIAVKRSFFLSGRKCLRNDVAFVIVKLNFIYSLSIQRIEK